MTIPRSVHARLVERLIFNFRFKPGDLDKVLPANWLKAQDCNGWSIVSFCILSLNKVIIWPLPGFLGYKTTSCAYRCGIIDNSTGEPCSSVYITDRQTNLPLIARIAPWFFLDTILMVRPVVTHLNGNINVSIKYMDGQPMFSAIAKPAPWKSQVFETIEDFGHFIKGGVSSYTPSIYGDKLTRVDLMKEEPQYESLDADVDMSCLDGIWKETGVIFDSAVRASGGGKYKWTYRGMKSYS